MNKEIFGLLFNKVTLESEEHLDIILQTMNRESAVYFITQALSYAYDRGSFSLGESEVVSKSLRILNRREESLDVNIPNQK